MVEWANRNAICNLWIGEDDDGVDDDDDDFDINEDDSDDFTPAKAYKRNQKVTPGQPKRGRGRPKKIRDPVEEGAAEGSNWRNRKIHKCPHCIKKFTRRSHVTVHVRKRHGFECSICNSRWGGRSKLKNSFPF